MGGTGSGRRGGGDLTTDYRRLDVRALQRAGVLRPGYVGGWAWWGPNGEKRADIRVEAHPEFVRLRYSATPHRAERRDYVYAVHLSWTDCHYGGKRPWFICPVCGRRVAILYGGAQFVCRHCRELAYPVQRETDTDRIIRRADAIRKRLGWGAGILNPTGWKPKGMHWRTFWRLRSEYDRLVTIGLDGLARQLGIVNRRLDATERLLRRVAK